MQLAGAMAREDLRRYGEDALTQAKSVADRQTLQRMMADARSSSLGLYLRRSCNSDTIVACAVFESGKLVAQAGVSLPWDEDRGDCSRAGRAISRIRRLSVATR